MFSLWFGGDLRHKHSQIGNLKEWSIVSCLFLQVYLGLFSPFSVICLSAPSGCCRLIDYSVQIWSLTYTLMSVLSLDLLISLSLAVQQTVVLISGFLFVCSFSCCFVVLFFAAVKA